MNGFFNRLLRIDLSRRQYRYEELEDDLLARTLGGKGLGGYLLARENPPGVDPFSGESRFIIAAGPVAGTRMWSQSRFAVFAKSPATGGYGESYCGGSLAPRLKGCGVDAVILEGECPELTWLSVDEHGAAFHEAGGLSRADTFTTEAFLLRSSPPGSRAMVIGPAGENRVAFACIKSDRWRSLGRGGLGAVLGAKNVKGIAFAGVTKAVVADEQLMSGLIRKISQKGKGSPITETYRTMGTPSQVRVTNQAGCFPSRYWQAGRFAHWERLSADYLNTHFQVKSHGCPNCFLQCTKKTRILEGRHRGLELEGPEYETIYALGGLNCIDSMEEVAWLNDLCDRLGVDTMSAGNIAAFAIEARRRGRLAFPIDYNQPDRVAELLRLITRREGPAAVLAEGIQAAARALGLEGLAVHVKGLEPAGFDPRVLKGMALAYATAARGACHLRGTFYKAELSGQIEKDRIRGKARLLIDYEDRAALFDSLILCRFYRDFIGWEELAVLIRALTGLAFDRAGLEILANRITQATRNYNRREGIDETADMLPERLFSEATEEGASLRRQELETMIADYNSIRRQRDE
jgi:aldehyde:ferredoxin oxidoreductase